MSSNSTDSYYYTSLDDWLTYYGSTPSLDSFNLYGTTTVSILGFILNFISLAVFIKFESSRLTVYLRVYSIVNIISCFNGIFNFTYSSYRILSWTNSYGSQLFYNYISTPIVDLCYFYGTCLDIYILLDRLSYFNNMAKRLIFNQYDPLKLCIGTLIFCVVIDTPFYLIYATHMQTVVLNGTFNYTIWYSSTSEFTESLLFKVFQYMLIAFKDVSLLLIELGLNIASIYLFNEFVAKKRKLIGPLLARVSIQETTNRSGPVRSSQALTVNPDRKLAMMVILMCSMSILEHVVSLSTTIITFFSIDLTLFIMYSLTNFCAPCRRFLLFFLFITFNRKYRQTVLECIRRFF